MRGCKCAISTKAVPKFFPSFSSSAALCRAVRSGQLSKRTKMITIVIATMRATTVNAIGHETRCDFAEFDIGCLTLSVSVSSQPAIEQEHDRQQEQKETGRRFACKKLPPPTPDRREGRLFPPEQL